MSTESLSPAEIRERYNLDEQSLLSRMKENRLGYFFIAPTFLMFLLVFYFPILRGVWISLNEYTLGRPPEFVGLGNYTWMVTNDLFIFSLMWTIVFVVASTFLNLVLGLVAALLVNEVTRKNEWMNSILMSPYFSAGLAGGIIWMWFLNPDYGFSARIFQWVGMDSIYLLSEGMWPYVASIVAMAWHKFGYAGIIYVAALKSIPSDQYEAAALAGASRLRRFRDITIPHLMIPTVIILAIRTTWNIAEFALPFELTAGGPGTRTMILSILTYQTAYINFEFGRAYAIGMVMVSLSMIAAFLYVTKLPTEEEMYI